VIFIKQNIEWSVRMTEKRFLFVGSGIEDNKDNESYLYNKDGFQDVCDLLNEQEERIKELSEENEQLKKEKKELQLQCNLLREQANEFHRRARENANRVSQLEKENKELKEENEQLKQELNNFRPLYFESEKGVTILYEKVMGND